MNRSQLILNDGKLRNATHAMCWVVPTVLKAAKVFRLVKAYDMPTVVEPCALAIANLISPPLT
jgi:hypothetical protein